MNDKKIKIKIGSHLVGPNEPCFIVAEAGANHNHDLTIAKKMIEAAARAGADAVKFQSIKYDELYSPKFPPSEKIQALYPNIELPEAWYGELAQHAQKNKIIFLSCPTYLRAVDLLEKVGVLAYKIASPQTKANLPLVEYAARKQKPIFLSTGYCVLPEIKKAVQVCFSSGNKKIILLHCVAKYPTNAHETNLGAIPFLAKEFGLLSGFSDHTLGFHLTLGAVAFGACLIEKHFTLSRKMKGPDHASALEPKELKQMIIAIRELEAGFGFGKRNNILPAEKEAAFLMDTRILAKKDIKPGEKITISALHFKRLKKGILANDWQKVLQKKVKVAILKDEPLTFAKLK